MSAEEQLLEAIEEDEEDSEIVGVRRQRLWHKRVMDTLTI